MDFLDKLDNRGDDGENVYNEINNEYEDDWICITSFSC